MWPLVEQARQAIPDTPVIGCSVSPPLERALQAGAMDYLIKPVTRADLDKALKALGRPVKRLLVVDDAPDILQLLTRTVHACNPKLEVITASSGAQALHELRSRSPDLMLLDIVMPDMDGWQVLEHTSRDEMIRSIPVILVSAQDPTERPPMSNVLLATMDRGLPISKLLDCTLKISALLLKPD
jgi:CheY-like chemotaxis protein